MGSTPDIPTADILDKSLDRAESFSVSSLENGTGELADENASIKSAPVEPIVSSPLEQVNNVIKEPTVTIIDVTPPSSATSNSSASVPPLPPSATTGCTCPDSQPDLSSSTATTTTAIHRPSGPIKPMACEMCNNYELQLQEVQYREGVLSLQIATHEKTIKQLREELKKEQKFRAELEEKYNEEAKKTEVETRSLSLKVDEGQKTISKLTNKFGQFEKRSNDLVQELISQVEALKKDLSRVTHENEILLGRTLVRSAQLLSEEISLPQAADDMQLYCLKLREDLIQALVSKEHIEETLKSENLFLKEQLRGEQQSKENLEENFAQESEVLSTTLESKKLELHDYKKRCAEMQRELETLKANFNTLSVSSGARISELEHQCEELASYKSKAEVSIHQLREKVKSLQGDLENSEAVQRDFVKLSQSLQVQLEKIRQADTEVRWQHEDDVAECNSCKKAFHSKKEKINCKHCGRIFCSDCTSKVVRSGPMQRPNRVCNVCHTLLDNQTACWFVNEAPQSPT